MGILPSCHDTSPASNCWQRASRWHMFLATCRPWHSVQDLSGSGLVKQLPRAHRLQKAHCLPILKTPLCSPPLCALCLQSRMCHLNLKRISNSGLEPNCGLGWPQRCSIQTGKPNTLVRNKGIKGGHPTPMEKKEREVVILKPKTKQSRVDWPFWKTQLSLREGIPALCIDICPLIGK